MQNNLINVNIMALAMLSVAMIALWPHGPTPSAAFVLDQVPRAVTVYKTTNTIAAHDTAQPCAETVCQEI